MGSMCREMQLPHQHSRINLAELKAQLVKKLGPERSKQYFYYLNKLLSLKLSKVEFNKLCFRIIGRENVRLHNQLIRSVLKNACHAKVLPATSDKDALRSTIANGGVLWSGNGDWGDGEHLSLVGPNGKVGFVSHKITVMGNGSFDGILANGHSTQTDTRKPVQHHQEHTKDLANEGAVSVHNPSKLPPIKRSSADGPVSVHSNDQIKVGVVEVGKKVSARSVVKAPLGIPFCSVSIGGAQKALPLAGRGTYVSSFDNGGLLDTEMLRVRMEHIAASQGLEGVSMDCANLLNNGLDAYLKGLIRSCVELVGARSRSELPKNNIDKNKSCGKLVNGVLAGHHYQMQSSSKSLESVQDQKPQCPISLLDFKIAMELNPWQLGEDWPLLLERICTHAFEK